MTLLQVYNAVLTEISKEGAPNLLLDDFNYLANKAYNIYINKRYNLYDINQQTTDDLRVLKATAKLDAHLSPNYDDEFDFMNATYEVELPADYMHILNCICIYKVNNNTTGCYDKPYTRFPATRLTADSWSEVLDNFWNRPTFKRPYYYIHNVNKKKDVPTNPYNYEDNTGTDFLLPVNSFDIHVSFYKPIEVVITTTNNSYTLPVYKIYYGKIISESKVYIDKGKYYIQDLFNTDLGLYNLLGNREEYYKNEEISEITVNQDSGKSKTIFTYTTKNVDENGKYEIIIDVTDFLFQYYIKNNKLFDVVDDELDKITGHIWDFEINSINPSITYTFPRSINLRRNSESPYEEHSTVVKESGLRYGNASKVMMEIRYGADHSDFELVKVAIDYIKTPQHLLLTQSQLDRTTDTSQILEFPDYVCQEIVNELVKLILENISDPRLLTHVLVNLSIANPVQQLTPETAAQAAQ